MRGTRGLKTKKAVNLIVIPVQITGITIYRFKFLHIKPYLEVHVRKFIENESSFSNS